MPEQNTLGFSINIFMVDGFPDGLRIINKSNWDGLGVVCPRIRYQEKKTRDEFNRGGVYILFGKNGDDEILYIGESDNVRSRLDIHYTDRTKEFWQKVIIFTKQSGSHPLNKTQIGYLESCLVEKAKEFQRCQLDNSQDPRRPNISEAEEATAKAYLSDILLLLPVLGVFAFEEVATAVTKSQKTYKLQGKGWASTGYQTSNGFAVRKGSTASKTNTPTILSSDLNMREKLKEDPRFWKDINGCYRFETDYEFNSPSAAASVVTGARKNGLDSWRDDQNKTLKENLDLEQQES